MRKLLEIFHNIRFRNKMALSHISVALIPFVIFAVVSGSVFLSQARRTAMDHTAQITAQVTDSIDVYISTIDKLAEYISQQLQRTGFLESAESWSRMQAYTQTMLRELARSHEEIAGILIASGENGYVSTGMSRVSRDPFTAEDWYQRAAQRPGEIVLVSNVAGRNIVTNKDYSVDDVFSLAKAVTDPDGKVRGVVLFDVRHDIIQRSISRVTIGENGFVFVLDDQDNMVYTPVNTIVYRVDPTWLRESGKLPVTVKIGKEKYHIRYDQSLYTGWKTVGVFSLSEVMGGVNTIVSILLVCVLGTGFLVLLVSLRLADSITKPISKLRRLMKQAESGDLTVHFNSLYNDEIGDLGESFNHMIGRIDQLLRRIYEEQRQKRDAELKSLQEQIKPHFLYNTLDTIGWMARDYGADDIVRLVDALTSMFRIGLSHGKDFISVQEETIHVSNYLYIQKIRYKDRLNYQIEVPESLYGWMVPKLILQPLVENAIYHGIKQKRGGGTVHISGRLSANGKALEFLVRDDGAGMPSERLSELQKQLAEPSPASEKPSFGLFYIAERIRLCYGETYGITLESIQGQGTTVSVTMPAQNTVLIEREGFHV